MCETQIDPVAVNCNDLRRTARENPTSVMNPMARHLRMKLGDGDFQDRSTSSRLLVVASFGCVVNSTTMIDLV